MTDELFPDTVQVNTHKDSELETAFIVDIFMRILAGRTLPVCLNSAFSVIHTLAHDLPEDGRGHLIDTLKEFTEHLISMKDKPKETMQ